MAEGHGVNPWELAQEHLQSTLDNHDYNHWFAPTAYESFDAGHLKLGVPSQFFADWLRDHYMDAICSSMRKVAPEFQSVQFSPNENGSTNGIPEKSKLSVRTNTPAQGASQNFLSEEKVRIVKRSYTGFNPRYTFDRFVIGGGNRFAHAAARAVAESPGRAYNPLFLYGGTGMGKTHLMQSIGQGVLQRTPNSRCVFISSEHFTNQLIQSIAEKSTQRFRERYRKVDLLLIDDIHFIAGKEATQEEFFHTFNTLFDSHKQIVISSDRPPKEILGIEERLVSRFESGLVTDIQPPDLETRIAILQSKATRENLTVPQDVMRYIATYITTNIRELEGAMITVLAYARLTEQKITIPMVEDVLRDLIGSEKVKPTTPEQVQRAVAEHFDVRIADLRGRSRQRQIVRPRQLAMFLCKELIPSMSLNDIGDAFGGKDHTTVIYACDQVAKKIKLDATQRLVVDQLTKAIRS